uniref:Ig-like domain-containing protein n=1 Tax=Anopheles minimus TaxID=112268 RepID=A0A182W8F9_9DIPT
MNITPNSPADHTARQDLVVAKRKLHSSAQLTLDGPLLKEIVPPGDKTPAGFPVIKQIPTIRVIETGHTAVMQCKATGSPPPKIYWIKDMKRVDMTNPRYSINSEVFVHSHR